MEIIKALFGLSSRVWAIFLGDALTDIGFYPLRVDPDLWMNKLSKYDDFNFIASFVVDSIVASKNLISNKFNLRNGDESPVFFLGSNYSNIENKTNISQEKHENLNPLTDLSL